MSDDGKREYDLAGAVLKGVVIGYCKCGAEVSMGGRGRAPDFITHTQPQCVNFRYRTAHEYLAWFRAQESRN